MTAIVDASAEIALPTLVSTLSICIVFLPMFLLPGVARYLFVPLAEAVVFAMLASYFFSRTLIPTLAMYLLRHERKGDAGATRGTHALARFQQRFEHGFETLGERYHALLQRALARPGKVVATFAAICLASMLLLPVLGRDFFPTSDTGEIRLHMRVKTGTRIEQTARMVDLAEQKIRTLIPPSQLSGILDNIGLPISGINLTYDSSSPVGSADADILITLKPGHKPTQQYVSLLRETLGRDFPGTSFAFLPADIISQILDFGLPSPIDVQIVGNNEAANRATAEKLLQAFRKVPGLVDPRIQQPDDAPAINVEVDRTKAIQAGFQQRTIAQNLLIALSGSSQTTPNFWLNPKNGVSYPLMTESPQYTVDSLQALGNIPLNATQGSTMPLQTGQTVPILGSLSTFQRANQDAVVSHYNVQPVIDIFAGVQGRDLGAVAGDISRLVKQASAGLGGGSSIEIRGEVQTMQSSFQGLMFGLLFAVGLVYALMVVNFQSWIDPLVIICALPGALAGIAWMLFVTGTTVSVPALTGSIMCIGIATANSILVVSFARERLAAGASALEAAFDAGSSRFRPVLMTALAMLIGMLPMAIGLGDGGEQNAPLGRAVIGGLMFGTVSTLIFVPTLFATAQGWLQRRAAASAPGDRSLDTELTS
jgi:multidrug efflux pump subunit AcrB